MSLTPNFGFNIPTGTDTVNLLTQCYPNFTSLDGILQAIKESGVSTATQTKAGTVHQLVRTVTDCNVFRFVATANYVAGDTFTVDGSPVTATAVDGTSLNTGAFVINQNVLCVINGSVLTILVSGSASTSATDVTYNNTGSGLTASNVQDAIDELVGDIPTSFAASAITYDNSGSGLSATDVQDAIDELASGCVGSDHGMYELWKNATPTAAFVPATITISGFDNTEYDSVEFELAFYSPENSGEVIRRLTVDVLSGTPKVITMQHQEIGLTGASTGKIKLATRDYTVSLSGTTLTIDVGSASLYYVTSLGTLPTATTDNNYLLPTRILGLKHNTI